MQDRDLDPVSASTRLDCPKRRRAHESWWSVRRASGRSLASRFFSRACAVLVSAHDGRVDHHVLVIGIAGQQLENPLENAALCPSAEALVYDLPVAKTRRQVTPGNAGSVSIKNRVNEQTVVRCSAADMAFPARQIVMGATASARLLPPCARRGR